jgi:hypothetical protein
MNAGLQDLIRRAMTRHGTTHLPDLQSVARLGGHQLALSTLVLIQEGRYRATPGARTVQALAYLAGVSVEDAWAAVEPPRCGWFIPCDNVADAGRIEHPACPDGVPVCSRCRALVDQLRSEQ